MLSPFNLYILYPLALWDVTRRIEAGECQNRTTVNSISQAMAFRLTRALLLATPFP